MVSETALGSQWSPGAFFEGGPTFHKASIASASGHSYMPLGHFLSAWWLLLCAGQCASVAAAGILADTSSSWCYLP